MNKRPLTLSARPKADRPLSTRSRRWTAAEPTEQTAVYGNRHPKADRPLPTHKTAMPPLPGYLNERPLTPIGAKRGRSSSDGKVSRLPVSEVLGLAIFYTNRDDVFNTTGHRCWTDVFLQCILVSNRVCMIYMTSLDCISLVWVAYEYHPRDICW